MAAAGRAVDEAPGSGCMLRLCHTREHQRPCVLTECSTAAWLALSRAQWLCCRLLAGVQCKAMMTTRPELQRAAVGALLLALPRQRAELRHSRFV